MLDQKVLSIPVDESVETVKRRIGFALPMMGGELVSGSGNAFQYNFGSPSLFRLVGRIGATNSLIPIKVDISLGDIDGKSIVEIKIAERFGFWLGKKWLETAYLNACEELSLMLNYVITGEVEAYKDMTFPEANYAKKMTADQRTLFISEVSKYKRNPKTGFWLSLLLGTFGAHHFYLKKTLLGVVYVVFCWTWIPTTLGIFESIFMFKRVEAYNMNCAQEVAMRAKVLI